MARYGIVPRSEPINAVIFQGTPSQLINLPAFIKGAVAILAIGIGFGYASTQWPVPWFIPVLAVLLVLVGIGLAYLQVKFTEFEIDVERITCRKGILNRTVQSVELFRIQDVTSVHPWWQRMFGIGAVVVMTSDSNMAIGSLRRRQPLRQAAPDLPRSAGG